MVSVKYTDVHFLPVQERIEGRRSLELINAIYESIETEKEIFLRFKPKKCKLGKWLSSKERAASEEMTPGLAQILKGMEQPHIGDKNGTS